MALSFSLCSMLLFLKLYGFFTNCNKSEIIPGEIPCFVLKISVTRVWRFFWCILTLSPLTSIYQKCKFRESSFFHDIVSVFHVSTAWAEASWLHQKIIPRRAGKRHVFFNINIAINFHQWYFIFFNKTKDYFF